MAKIEIVGGLTNEFARAKVWVRDNPWWSFLGVVLGVVGIVLALALWLIPLITRDPEVFRAGQSAKSDPFIMTYEKSSCGHDSFPASVREQAERLDAPPLPQVQGQLCFVEMKFHNDSASATLFFDIPTEVAPTKLSLRFGDGETRVWLL